MDFNRISFIHFPLTEVEREIQRAEGLCPRSPSSGPRNLDLDQGGERLRLGLGVSEAEAEGRPVRRLVLRKTPTDRRVNVRFKLIHYSLFKQMPAYLPRLEFPESLHLM